MNPSSNCLKLLQAFEGIVDGDKTTPNYEPYICPANVYTVGYGHSLFTAAGQQINVGTFGPAKALHLAKDSMHRKFGKQAITLAEADALLKADSLKYALAVEKVIPSNTTQAQFDALSSFAFNVGQGNFDISAIKRLHNAGKRTVGTISIPDLYGKARNKASPTSLPIAFVRWSNMNGQFALGLFRRRIAELLVYSGWDATKAYQTAVAFKG